jgi:hypothetical protein
MPDTIMPMITAPVSRWWSSGTASSAVTGGTR